MGEQEQQQSQQQEKNEQWAGRQAVGSSSSRKGKCMDMSAGELVSLRVG